MLSHYEVMNTDAGRQSGESPYFHRGLVAAVAKVMKMYILQTPDGVRGDSRFKRDGHRSALPSFENLLHDDVRRVPRSANAILRNVECAYLGRRTESEFDRS